VNITDERTCGFFSAFEKQPLVEGYWLWAVSPARGGLAAHGSATQAARSCAICACVVHRVLCWDRSPQHQIRPPHVKLSVVALYLVYENGNIPSPVAYCALPRPYSYKVHDGLGIFLRASALLQLLSRDTFREANACRRVWQTWTVSTWSAMFTVWLQFTVCWVEP
jgi:hypothetical protein